MNKGSKKIIAREFLFIIGTCVVYIMLIVSWDILYRSNYRDREEINKQIDELIDFESLPYRLKVYYFIKENFSVDMPGRIEFIGDLKDQTLALKTYEYLKDNNKVNSSEDQFLEKIHNDKESERYLVNIQTLENQLKQNRENLFFKGVTEDMMILIAIYLIGIVFIFRYLIYATRWSIKQLKE
ncbi:hypothetical protein LVD15_04235 [Fulvivirga maritima]|uniref:hypothetical protein n=1 Tax=Fulvivirga maritima TaxID=2904247 RepID=UPI001F3C6C27|nr:hypothetical protein [Fulvivirga maritima]UII27641.1 hypothetical protein LVD15_04235 [Fulvivirga maritima]